MISYIAAKISFNGSFEPRLIGVFLIYRRRSDFFRMLCWEPTDVGIRESHRYVLSTETVRGENDHA